MITCNEDNIRELIDGNTRVIVQFGAQWCGPCRTMKPRLDEISVSFPSMTFAYVDIDDSPLLAKEMGIMALPTVIGFVNGSPISQVVGSSLSEVVSLAKKVEQST